MQIVKYAEKMWQFASQESSIAITRFAEYRSWQNKVVCLGRFARVYHPKTENKQNNFIIGRLLNYDALS